MSDMLERLTEARENAVLKARHIHDTAVKHNRNLSSGEQIRFDEGMKLVDDLDSRIADETDLSERNARADVVRARFEGVGASSTGRTVDADLDAAFRSAIRAKNPAPIEIPVSSRTHYQPGLEQRDLLKSTATQAMGVSTYDQIVQHMVENSAVLRAGATVLNTPTGEDLQIPKSTGFSTANLITEGSSITESDPTLGVVTLKSYKYAAFFQISSELANDGNKDLLSFLSRQAGVALALAYGDKLINGTGTGEPRGVLADTTAGITGPVGTATTLGAQGTVNQGTDVLYGMHGSLAEPYAITPSRAWLMRNASLTTIRKLKDTVGQPVLPADGDSFLGAPFVVDPFVPAMAANAKSIIYGDFSRYFVRFAQGLRFERSDDFGFQNDLVTFRAVIRVDGALCDNNAIKHFVNSAT